MYEISYFYQLGKRSIENVIRLSKSEQSKLITVK